MQAGNKNCGHFFVKKIEESILHDWKTSVLCPPLVGKETARKTRASDASFWETGKNTVSAPRNTARNIIRPEARMLSHRQARQSNVPPQHSRKKDSMINPSGCLSESYVFAMAFTLKILEKPCDIFSKRHLCVTLSTFFFRIPTAHCLGPLARIILFLLRLHLYSLLFLMFIFFHYSFPFFFSLSLSPGLGKRIKEKYYSNTPKNPKP